MTPELEFVMDGFIVVGLWILLMVGGVAVWARWNRRGPTPKPAPKQDHYPTRRFKYTDTAPPVQSVLRRKR